MATTWDPAPVPQLVAASDHFGELRQLTSGLGQLGQPAVHSGLEFVHHRSPSMAAADFRRRLASPREQAAFTVSTLTPKMCATSASARSS